MSPLLAIQRGLEGLYRIDTDLNVADFLLTRDERDDLTRNLKSRLPREQLLVRESQDGDEVDLAVYIEEEILSTLSRHDPRHGLSECNVSELLLCLEGVSHFIYTVTRARQQRTVSALELELQAEVNKYVALVLLCWDPGGGPPGRHPQLGHLITRLFRQVIYDPALSGEEHDRYRSANHSALSYAEHLERRYLSRYAMPDFLGDVRRFWRLSYAGKLHHITGMA